MLSLFCQRESITLVPLLLQDEGPLLKRVYLLTSVLVLAQSLLQPLFRLCSDDVKDCRKGDGTVYIGVRKITNHFN